MLRSDSMSWMRFLTNWRYDSGQCAGNSVMGVERCRSNQVVSNSSAAIFRAITISNARSPSSS
jgi:hypothetical protein